MPQKICHIWPKVSRLESSKHRQSARSGSGMSSDRSRMGIAWKTQTRSATETWWQSWRRIWHVDRQTYRLTVHSQLSFKHSGLNLPYTEIQLLSPNILIRHLSVFTSEKLWSIRCSFYTWSCDLFLQLFLFSIYRVCYIKLKMSSK